MIRHYSIMTKTSTTQCIGVIRSASNTTIRCPNHKVLKIQYDSADSYLSQFCSEHYRFTRPFYHGYKKTGDAALALFNKISVNAEQNPTRVLIRCYSQLSEAIRLRQEYMQHYVYETCQDQGHLEYIVSLDKSRDLCENWLKQRYAEELALRKQQQDQQQRISSAEEKTESVIPKDEQETEVFVMGGKMSRNQKARYNRKQRQYLNRCLEEVQVENQAMLECLSAIPDKLEALSRRIIRTLVVPWFEQSLFTFKLPTQVNITAQIHYTDEFLDCFLKTVLASPLDLLHQMFLVHFQGKSKLQIQPTTKLSDSFKNILMELNASSLCFMSELAAPLGRDDEVYRKGKTVEQIFSNNNCTDDNLARANNHLAEYFEGSEREVPLQKFQWYGIEYIPRMLNLLARSNITSSDAQWFSDTLCDPLAQLEHYTSGGFQFIQKQTSSTGGASYIESMFRYHQEKYQHQLEEFYSVAKFDAAFLQSVRWIMFKHGEMLVPVLESSLSALLSLSPRQFLHYALAIKHCSDCQQFGAMALLIRHCNVTAIFPSEC